MRSVHAPSLPGRACASQNSVSANFGKGGFSVSRNELARRHATGVVNRALREHEDGPTPPPRSARPPRSRIVSEGPGPVHAPFGPFRPARERRGARKSPAAREGGYGPSGPRVFYYPAERGRDDRPLPAPKELPRPRSRRSPQNSTSKPSEKGRKSLRHSLTEHRNGPFKPILASLHRLNPRLGRCSYTFSDSFHAKFGE
jgi:hypothetical protein